MVIKTLKSNGMFLILPIVREHVASGPPCPSVAGALPTVIQFLFLTIAESCPCLATTSLVLLLADHYLLDSSTRRRFSSAIFFCSLSFPLSAS